MTDELWAVLAVDPAGPDNATLAAFLAKQQQVPLMDAQRMARHSWGFLAERLTEPAARALAEAAGRAGIPARAEKSDALPHPPDPVVIHGAVWNEGRVDLQVGVPPAPHPLACDRIGALALASLRRDVLVSKTVQQGPSLGRRLAGLGLLAVGVPVGMGKTKEVQSSVRESEWVLFFDIVSSDGRWRARPEAFDFSGLGAVRTFAAAENFKRLLARFRQTAPGALLNRGARWFLEGRPLAGLGYDDFDDFEKECRWLYSLRPSR